MDVARRADRNYKLVVQEDMVVECCFIAFVNSSLISSLSAQQVLAQQSWMSMGRGAMVCPMPPIVLSMLMSQPCNEVKKSAQFS